MGLTALVGAAAAIVFVVVFTFDGWTRTHYDPRHQTVSALALGSRGWLQTANFLVCGAGITVGAAGLWSAHPWLATALGVLGVALIASGLWRMDPMRGYPPGIPDTEPSSYSLSHRLHDHAGAVVFFALPVAPVVAALSDVDGWLRWYSVATAIACTWLVGKFGTAWENDSPLTGVWQRLALAASLVWAAVLFMVA